MYTFPYLISSAVIPTIATYGLPTWGVVALWLTSCAVVGTFLGLLGRGIYLELGGPDDGEDCIPTEVAEEELSSWESDGAVA